VITPLSLEILNWVVTVSWFIPIYFLAAAGAGNYLRKRKERKYKKDYMRPLDLIIFQVPTIGQNPAVLNKIFETVKGYKSLPIRVETWVVIEETDDPAKYCPYADRAIIVPKDFLCYAKAKARALEYARRERINMVERKEIPEKYLIVQGDDDSTPSEELLYESLYLDIDLISAMILPSSKSGSRITRITDHQRLYACTCSCMFAINAEIPIWGHGEAMIYSHKVDKALNYEFIPLNGKKLKGYDDIPHMGNEDMYYTHKCQKAGFSMTTRNILVA
jgi:hypothetical protein